MLRYLLTIAVVSVTIRGSQQQHIIQLVHLTCWDIRLESILVTIISTSLSHGCQVICGCAVDSLEGGKDRPEVKPPPQTFKSTNQATHKFLFIPFRILISVVLVREVFSRQQQTALTRSPKMRADRSDGLYETARRIARSEYGHPYVIQLEENAR